jgi:L-amino acid N-acyltransferase YncA
MACLTQAIELAPGDGSWLTKRCSNEKIFTYILADNPAALATYQKHGFRIVGKAERHANLHGRYVDVNIVERLL